MLTRPMDILTEFPVRKSKSQKQAFRDAVQAYMEQQEYRCQVEEGRFGARNLIIGDPENAKYLLTAHYDTCARLPFPNLLTPFNPVLFVLYQIGVSAFLLLIDLILSIFVGYLTLRIGVPIISAGQEMELAALTVVVWYYSFFLFIILSDLMLYFGPANQNNANDNTSGVVTLLEIARTFPENQRDKVCFVLFDLEEKGLWGSKAYRKMHKKATDHQLILNLDCVGDGDHIRLFPTKKLKKDRKKLTSLYKACGYVGKKSILVHEKGFGIYPSDQRNFPYGVGICALRDSRYGLYLGKIHTSKDTTLEETNVNILRAALTTFITCDN